MDFSIKRAMESQKEQGGVRRPLFFVQPFQQKKKKGFSFLCGLLFLGVTLMESFSPSPSPASAASASTQRATSTGTGEKVMVSLQAYAYPDNSDGGQVTRNTAAIAYPKREGFPTLHEQATEGVGTIDAPITFAAYEPLTKGDQAVFPPGAKIYVEALRKYFILEDTCNDCEKSPAGTTYSVRLWLGPSQVVSKNETLSLENCVNKIAQTTSGIVFHPSSDYPVEKTPLYSNGACTTKIFPDQTSKPGGDTTPTAQPPQKTPTMQLQETPTTVPPQEGTPTAQPAAPTAPSQQGASVDGKSIKVAVTSFGFPDNDDGSGHYGTAVIAFPKSDGYRTLHNQATEGTGTSNDPITFAAYVGDTVGPNPAFPPGTRIYVPFLRKYFILEDQCAGCNDGKNGNAYHIDLWLGPGEPGANDTAQSIEACEGSITHDSELIILNPAATHPVDTTPLYKDGVCTARQYDQ